MTTPPTPLIFGRSGPRGHVLATSMACLLLDLVSLTRLHARRHRAPRKGPLANHGHHRGIRLPPRRWVARLPRNPRLRSPRRPGSILLTTETMMAEIQVCLRAWFVNRRSSPMRSDDCSEWVLMVHSRAPTRPQKRTRNTSRCRLSLICARHNCQRYLLKAESRASARGTRMRARTGRRSCLSSSAQVRKLPRAEN